MNKLTHVEASRIVAVVDEALARIDYVRARAGGGGGGVRGLAAHMTCHRCARAAAAQVSCIGEGVSPDSLPPVHEEVAEALTLQAGAEGRYLEAHAAAGRAADVDMTAAEEVVARAVRLTTRAIKVRARPACVHACVRVDG